MTARVGVIASLLLALLALPAVAQDAELDRVLGQLGANWARGDAAALVDLGGRAGISFELRGERIGPLSSRQAAAVLRRLFDGRETLSVRHGMAQVVGGSPPRAFGELAWVTRVAGTTIPEHSTVLFALVRDREGWRITQIRLIQ